MLLHPQAPRVLAPTAIGDEILEHLPGIAHKRKLDLGLLLPVLAALPVQWVAIEIYAAYEEQARLRMKARDEEDWPAVALALALVDSESVAIWTQDKDFEVSGMNTIETGTLLDRLEGRASFRRGRR
ncbi:MAG TPA: PIN domain-containing protein [Candidatus Micrarchaeaceae archaeon]|nr:PIN domain-containing protein [Candidatus Micrarchaeaceae archaeon]